MKTVRVCPRWPAMQPMEWCPMARGLVEMMWPCMRWWASQCHLQPPDPLQTIPLTTSSPPRDLLPSHTTLRTLPMMSSLVTSKYNNVSYTLCIIATVEFDCHYFLYGLKLFVSEHIVYSLHHQKYALCKTQQQISIYG